MNKLLAHILALPRVHSILMSWAVLTPYTHLDGYMYRWWLVPNADPEAGPGCGPVDWRHRPLAWLLQRRGIMVRIHLILQPDPGQYPHDHPWDARTYIMQGSYVEERVEQKGFNQTHVTHTLRSTGETAELRHGEFHRISWVQPEGALTLFVAGEKQGDWGFLVKGRKIPAWAYAYGVGKLNGEGS